MDRRENKDSVSKKILETTRETERLKEELQSLIAAGLRGRTSPLLTTSCQYEPVNSTNKVQILKSYDSKHSQHVKREMDKPGTSFLPNPEIPGGSARKQKAYNVDEAREYLQNQRKKRALELRSLKTDTKATIDVRKEKLKELQEKANEIVKKNVQAKRSRSKSREPAIIRSRSANVPNAISSFKTKKPLEDGILGQNCTTTSRPSSSKALCLQDTNSVRKTIAVNNVNTEERGLQSVKSPHLLTVPKVKYGVFKSSKEDLTAKALPGPTCRTSETVAQTLESKQSSQVLSLPSSGKSYEKSAEKYLPFKKIEIRENVVLKPADDIPKLMEPEIRKLTPHWLKERPQTDPYNFINTIKRRCQLDYGITAATNKPLLVDVGVQSNIGATQNSSIPTSKSELFSFKSHKHLNLDRKHVGNLELGVFKDGLTTTKSTQHSSENESDTSKNIPSISSESGSCLPRNMPDDCLMLITQSYDMSDLNPLEEAPPNLDAEKIEDIKLKVFQEVSSCYSSDFPDASRSSRESIISYNKSENSPSALVSNQSNLDKENRPRNLFEAGPEAPAEKEKSSVSSQGVVTDVDNRSSKGVLQGAIPKSSSSMRSKSRSVKGSARKVIADETDNISEKLSIPEVGSNASSTNSHWSSSVFDSKILMEHKALSRSKEPVDLLKSKSQPVLSECKPKEIDCSKSEPQIPNRSARSQESNKRRLLMQNITLRSSDVSNRGSGDNVLHLKFEAEIHLLTDFNQTIQRFSEIERTFESLRGDSASLLDKKSTQTSVSPYIPSTVVTNTTVSSRSIEVESGCNRTTEIPGSQIPVVSSTTLDLTTASDLDTTLYDKESILDMSLAEQSNTSLCQQSGLNSNGSLKSDQFTNENFVFKNVIGMSVKVFDQLIKDEDARIENWRKMLKIREQFLLDRTRGELQFLEMQRKQLIETGKLVEASIIKKKQRCILLKHQEERNEMQRLKQMQKEESQKRKTVLRNERNSFKKELLSNKMLVKLKMGSRDRHERRLSGPFKVIQVSASSGTDQEIKSISARTSRTQSIINPAAEGSDHVNTDMEAFDWNLKSRPNITADAVSGMQKNLLMREHVLAERRKTVEELLKWHKRLLHEEKSIDELESRVGKIITKIPIEDNARTPDKVSSEETTASSMSQIALETVVTDQEVIHSRVASSTNYTADFEVETASHKSDDQSSVSSINQLIEDLSKIKDNILNSSLIQAQPPPSLNEADTESLLQTHGSTNNSIQENHANASIRIVECLEGSLSKKSEPERAPSEEDSIQEDVDVTSSPGGSESDRNVISFASIKEGCTEIEASKEVGLPTQYFTDEQVLTIEEQAGVPEGQKKQLAQLDLEPAALEIEPVVEPLIHPEIASTSSVTVLDENIAPTALAASAFQLVSAECATSEITSKEDISTSKQCEEIEDLDYNEPSTSHQYTAVLSLDLDKDVSESSDTLPSSVHSEVQSGPLLQEERQLFENKTDEEKAASLSGKSALSSKVKVKLDSPGDASTSTREDQSLVTDSGESGSILGIKGRFSIASDAVDKLTDKDLKSQTVSVESVSEKDSSSPKRVTTDEASTSAENISVVINETSSIQSQSAETSIGEKKPFSLGTEAEELHRKQLAIEQEIKLLKEQQQKEAASPFYIREIPNKPPPPYTPPSKAKVPKPPSVTPGNKDEVEQITEYSAKIIHKAYLSNNLDNIAISDNTLNLIAKNIDKGCYKYVFDLCKEIAIDHYGTFLAEAGPSWMHPERKPLLASTRPLDVNGLKELMNKKLLEMFGFKNRETRKENAIIKWSRKKRDHVDEVLVQNMHSEESTWTSFDKSEAIVKDQLTHELLQMLLADTVEVMKAALQKKMNEGTG